LVCVNAIHEYTEPSIYNHPVMTCPVFLKDKYLLSRKICFSKSYFNLYHLFCHFF